MCGSNQGSRCVELEDAYKCRWYSEFSGIGWVLSEIYWRIFEDKQAHDPVAREGQRFEWTPACEASLQELKKRLMTALVLVMPAMEKSFSIYCDAPGQGLGCELMQDDHVVGYVSR
jgi:hypothetical protein